MFGYVRPYKDEMVVREYEQYKAIYCELCRQIGKNFGVSMRFTLSYDCTFYAALALSVSGAQVKAHQGRCMVNPMKKCSFIAAEGDAYKKASALSVLMTYHKLCDNIEDEGFFKRSAAKISLFFIKRKARKAAEMYPFMAESAEKAMKAQTEAENDENSSIDRCSEPFAVMLGEILRELGGCDEMQSMALEQLGYFLGRWIYIMDAADDLTEDLREESFNPFIKKLSLTGKKELSEDERKQADIECNEVLNSTMARLLLPLNLINLENFAPIIENILKKGLPEMQREILFLHIKDKTAKNKT